MDNLHLVPNEIKMLYDFCVCSRVPSETITIATANSLLPLLPETVVILNNVSVPSMCGIRSHSISQNAVF